MTAESPFLEGTKLQYAWDSTSLGELKLARAVTTTPSSRAGGAGASPSTFASVGSTTRRLSTTTVSARTALRTRRPSKKSYRRRSIGRGSMTRRV
jgi:hypothetical protein